MARLPNRQLGFDDPPTRRARILSTRVTLLEYVHVDDPEGRGVVRYHHFKPGAEMWVLEDGNVLIRGTRGQPLWEDDGA